MVTRNKEAALAGVDKLIKIKIPDSWGKFTTESEDVVTGNENFDNLSRKIARMEGDDLPVSAFDPHGRYDTGMTKFEKRGIAPSIPIVDMNKCTQCNLCSVICPHAAIRPFLLNAKETSDAPFASKPAKGGSVTQGFNYRIQVSPFDCTGCEACSWTCQDDALTMVPVSTLGEGDEAFAKERANWDFAIGLPERKGLFHRSGNVNARDGKARIARQDDGLASRKRLADRQECLATHQDRPAERQASKMPEIGLEPPDQFVVVADDAVVGDGGDDDDW